MPNKYTASGVLLGTILILIALLTGCSTSPGPLADYTTVSYDSASSAGDLEEWIATENPSSRKIVKSPADGAPMYNIHEDLYRRLHDGDSVFLLAEMPKAGIAYVVVANAGDIDTPYSIGYVDAAYIGSQQ